MHAALLFLTLVATRIPLPHGFRPAAIASADFNGDHNADLAVAGASEVIIFFGDGRGGFRVAARRPAGANPSSISATNAFIAIANHETDYVTLIDTATFTPHTLHLHSNPHPHAVAIGDFDGDGQVDLAVDSWADSRIMLLFGRNRWRGPGTPVDIGTKPYWTIAAADLNGDGHTDLVTPNAGRGTVSILLGDGHGHFAHAHGSPFGAGSAAFAAAIADVNGDGKPDVVVANYSGHATDTANDGLTWIRNDGAGRFTAFPQRIAPGNYSARIATGDLDGDRFADTVFTNGNASTVTIVHGSATGPRAVENVTVMPHPHAVAIAGRCIAVTSDDIDELVVLCPSPQLERHR